MISEDQVAFLKKLAFDLVHYFHMCSPKYKDAKKALVEKMEILSENEKLVFLEHLFKYQNDHWDVYFFDKNRIFEFISLQIELKRSRLQKGLQFPRETLSTIIMNDYIDQFYEFECRLIKEGWFKENGKCNKRSLVALILKLDHYGYFKVINKQRNLSNRSYSKQIKSFFESRYRLNLTEEFKPSRRKNIDFINEHPLLPNTKN